MADNSAAVSRHMAETIRKYQDARNQSQQQFNAMTGMGFSVPQTSTPGGNLEYSWGDYNGIQGAEEFANNNFLVKAAGTVSDVGNYVTYGATKAVEGIADALVGLAGWVGTWFGFDDQWADDFIKFDAAKYVGTYVAQTLNPADLAAKALTGHSLSHYSYLNDADDFVKNGVRNIGETVGEIGTFVVAGIFSGGSSVAVQAALAAASAASTMGQTVETDVNQGNELSASLGHGAIKGGIALGTNLVLGYVGKAAGGAIAKAGSKIGEKVGEKLGSKTAEVVVSKASSILMKAGIDGARQAAMVAADPLIKQITVDSEAIEKAYGSDEAIANTMSSIGQAFALGAITSAAMQTATEAADYAKRGKAGYMAKYEQENLEREQQTLAKDIRRANKAIQGMSESEAQAYLKSKIPEWDDMQGKIERRAKAVLDNLQGTKFSVDAEGKATGKSVDTAKRYVQSAKNQQILNAMRGAAQKGSEGGKILFEAGSSFTRTSEGGGVYEENGKKTPVALIGNKVLVSASPEPKAIEMAIGSYSDVPANGGIVVYKETPKIDAESSSAQLSINAPLVISEGGLENAKEEGYSPADIAKAMTEVRNATAFFKADDGSYKAIIKKGDDSFDVITIKEAKSANSVTNIEPMTSKEVSRLRSVAMSAEDVKVVASLDKFAPEETTQGRALIKEAAQGREGKVYSMRASSDAVNSALDYLNHELPTIASKGETLTLSRVGKSKIERVLFKDLNTTEAEVAVAKAVDGIMSLTLSYSHDENGVVTTEKGPLESILDEGYAQQVRKELTSVLSEIAASQGDPSRLSKLKEKYKEIISSLLAEVKKNKDYIPLAQKLTRAHDRAKDINEGFTAIPTNEDSIRANAEKSMLFPFSQSGVMKGGKLQLKPFVKAVRQLSDHYDNEHYGQLYNMGISLALDSIREWDANGNATPQQERIALKLYEDIRKVAVEDARRLELERIKTVSSSAYGMDALGMNKDMGPISQALFKGISLAADNRATLDIIFSESTEMGDSFINGLSKAAGQERNFRIESDAKIVDIQKELGLDKPMKPVTIDGNEMAYLDALEWRIALMMGEDSQNYKDATIGFSYKSSKKGKEILVNYSEKVDADLKAAIPDELAERAKDLILNEYYGGIIYDKMAEIYKSATNRELGELLPRGKYMRLVVRNMRSSLMSPTVKGGTSTSNLIQRKGTSLPLKSGGGVFAKARSIGKMVAYEAYMQPKLVELDAQLNTILEDGKTPFDHLPTPMQDFVRWTFKVYKGEITPESQGYLGQAFIAFALANPKTPLIQPLSALISGLSASEFLDPKLSAMALKPTGIYKEALENLYEVLPEARYRQRDGGAVYQGNTADVADNPLAHFAAKIAKGISKLNLTSTFDNSTVNFIMLSVLKSAAKELNLPINDKAVAVYAERRSRTLYMTQISNNPKFGSPIQMVSNPYGQVTAVGSVLMRWGRAFGGARKAATNFFVRNVLKAQRMSKAKKYLDKTDASSFDSAIEKADKRVEAESDRIKSLDESIAEARRDRIAARDARTKDPELTAQWEIAQQDASEKRAYLEQVSKQKGMEAEVKAAQEAYDEAKAKAKSLKSGFNPEDQKVYEEAKAKEDALKKERRQAESDKREAENKKAAAEGRKSSYQKIKDEYDTYIKNGGARKLVATLVAGALLAGLSKTALDEVFKLLRNQKSMSDMKVDELLVSTFLNSTANLLPVLSNLTGFFQGSDSSDPATQAITNVMDLARSAINFCQDQSDANLKSLIRSTAQTGSMVSGIPLYNVYTYIRDITSHFSPEAAIAMNDVFYSFSASRAHKSYSEAINARDEKKAVAYIKQIMREEKAGEVSDSLAREMYSLSVEGNFIMPSASVQSYTNSKGELVKLTTAEEEAAKMVYSKANSVVVRMIATSQYKSLSSSAKGKAIKQVYDAYYEASKAKAIADYEPSSKMGVIASSTSIDISKFSTHIQRIKEMEATKTKSKKDLAVAYLNRTNLSKQERLLVLMLAGYSLKDDAKASVASYLSSKGMQRKKAKEMVGI